MSWGGSRDRTFPSFTKSALIRRVSPVEIGKSLCCGSHWIPRLVALGQPPSHPNSCLYPPLTTGSSHYVYVCGQPQFLDWSFSLLECGVRRPFFPGLLEEIALWESWNVLGTSQRVCSIDNGSLKGCMGRAKWKMLGQRPRGLICGNALVTQWSKATTMTFPVRQKKGNSVANISSLWLRFEK